MTPEPQIFNWPVRIYYEDTDVSGVVYHANYLRWFERARTEWLRALGIGQEALRLDHGIAFTVAGLEVAYLRPARLDDELEVVTQVAQVRRASLHFGQRLRRPTAPDQILAQATVRVACVDSATFKPRALPDIKWAPRAR